MGQEQPAAYYNQRMRRVSLPLEECPWREVYQVVLSLLPDEDVPIADIGCGTGRFAKLLQLSGRTQYLGIDFAEERIREARAYVPEFRFEVGNVLDAAVRELLQSFRHFVLTEVLEHIEDDVRLLESLPAGSSVIFSVPNYDSAGHVRHFENLEAVVERYQPVLDFTARHTITNPRKPHKKIFVLSARRRASRQE